VGAEGFAYISCFLKRYALFSLEPMPSIHIRSITTIIDMVAKTVIPSIQLFK